MDLVHSFRSDCSDTWADVTVVHCNTNSASRSYTSLSDILRNAEQTKDRKYQWLAYQGRHHLYPLAMDTLGPFGPRAHEYLHDLAQHLEQPFFTRNFVYSALVRQISYALVAGNSAMVREAHIVAKQQQQQSRPLQFDDDSSLASSASSALDSSSLGKVAGKDQGEGEEELGFFSASLDGGGSDRVRCFPLCIIQLSRFPSSVFVRFRRDVWLGVGFSRNRGLSVYSNQKNKRNGK